MLTDEREESFGYDHYLTWPLHLNFFSHGLIKLNREHWTMHMTTDFHADITKQL